MTSTILYMSMSVDGFIAAPNDVPGNGLGDDGERLHDWALKGGGAGDSGVPELVAGGVNGRVAAEFMSTGAVIAGRRTFEMAGGWGGDHHDGVPILILARREPSLDVSGWPLVSYVSDVETAFARAREGAGGKDVLVHGAVTAQLALAAGVLDMIELHVVPVLLGRGRRLFDDLDRVELERTRTLEGEDGVTHLQYRVRR